MKTKTFFGWAVILILSLIPVFLWGFFGPGLEELTEYSTVTHSLGEIFGLVGMTMFALTFVLSTRIGWIEDVFGGLDKVYIAHGILGGTALILILAHPIFLVLKFVPEQISLASTYLLPSSYWSVNFGIIALAGMIVLIFITLFTKMKYNKWKFTHEFLGAVFILAVLHIFLVRNTIAQDNIFSGYYFYAGIVSLIGISGFSYSLFLKDRLFKNAVYLIKKIGQKGDLFQITITPEHKPISYKAGQFVFLRFYNEHISSEAHPFSIASKSNERDMIIVVKKLGDFTNMLEHLGVGDKVAVEGPYGRFDYKKHFDRDQIWIAGGIGITPFIGMAQDILEDAKLKGRIALFYSVRKKEDLIGESLFKEIEKQTSKFKFVPWVSNVRGRIRAKDIYAKSGAFKDKKFFLCGPTGFKDGIIKELTKNGVDKNHIHEEVFDFR